jgi:hypothetical protein
MMRHTMRLVGAALVVGCALLIASCGYGVKEERLPKTGAKLEGTVSRGSEKLAAAMIIVAGKDSSATGEIDEATGRYHVENVPLGEVKIGVNTEAAKGQLKGKMMSGYYKGPEAKSLGLQGPPKIIDVPGKYANPETSGIQTTINSGSNTFDIVVPK